MLDHDAVPQGKRRTTALLFFGLLAVYSANGREIGAVDTIGNMLLPIAVARGDGLTLNRFTSLVKDHYWVKRRGDELVSRYPVLPALVALPLVWPQLALLDRVHPRWTSIEVVYWWWMTMIAKNAAAVPTRIAPSRSTESGINGSCAVITRAANKAHSVTEAANSARISGDIQA